jgi:hypothetical protein
MWTCARRVGKQITKEKRKERLALWGWDRVLKWTVQSVRTGPDHSWTGPDHSRTVDRLVPYYGPVQRWVGSPFI